MRVFQFICLGFLLLSMCVLSINKPIDSQVAEESANKQKPSCGYADLLGHDSKGVPYYDYGYVEGNYIGVQRNPLTVAHEALHFYEKYQLSDPKNESARQFFLNNADWLVRNAIMKQHNGSYSYSTYEYQFPLPVHNFEPPWRSAMAQGRALSVLIKANELTGNNTYLDTAKSVLNSFFIEVNDGGVTLRSPNSGWWYEQFASNDKDARNESRVLNGMIFAVLGIYEYHKYTRDPAAKYLLDQGILALKNDLPKYDNNGIAVYDALGRPANTDYQSLHIKLLGDLYNLTGEVIFDNYRNKWGVNFILNQFSGKNLADRYIDRCGSNMFGINIRAEGYNEALNLLDDDVFTWKSVNDAKVSQDNDNLNVRVDVDKNYEIYNRAYLQTQLNLTDDQQPLMLSLDYVAESYEGDAFYWIEVIDSTSSKILWSHTLDKTVGKAENMRFLLPKGMTNMPIEFRIYVITDEPGSHVLSIKKAYVFSKIGIDIVPKLSLL